jgi:transcriptional regulator with XRE-family HTH domain
MLKLGFFSELLIDSMARQGITAKVLAERAGCSYEHVRKLTRSEVLPSPILLRNLRDIFGWGGKRVTRFVRWDQGRKKFGDSFWVLSGRNPKYEEFYIIWAFLTREEKQLTEDYLRFLIARKQMRQPISAPVSLAS